MLRHLNRFAINTLRLSKAFCPSFVDCYLQNLDSQQQIFSTRLLTIHTLQTEKKEPIHSFIDIDVCIETNFLLHHPSTSSHNSINPSTIIINDRMKEFAF